MSRIRLLLRTAAFAGAPLLSGCMPYDGGATPYSSYLVGSRPQSRGDLGSLTYGAVDQMLAAAPTLARNTPLLVASISNVRDLETSGPLGNIVADLVRTRLVQKGLSVSDVRVRSAMLLRPQGEMMLSRRPRSLMGAPSVAAIVTGTYAISTADVLVSLKIESAQGRIISGADYVVPLNDVYRLVKTTRAEL